MPKRTKAAGTSAKKRHAQASVPWNGWFHCMAHTYGTWLPGDPKGFRTRHHREHVEGDYLDPPPKGTYDDRHEYAKGLLKREPVHLDPGQRGIVLGFVIESLAKRGIEVIIASLDSVHLHLLARFKDGDARKWVGIAKKESSYHAKADRRGEDQGVWAVRTKDVPVADRGHQLRIVKYIFDHEQEGAAIWFQGSLRTARERC